MAIRSSFSIYWLPTNLTQLVDKEDYYWYAITDLQKRLLYIGMTFDQSIQNRLSNRHHILARYANLGPDLIVWLGEIRYSNHRRVTRSMVEDVEALLIYLNQPSDNEQFKASYTRRNNLLIRSRNCPLLWPIIKIERGRFSPQKRLPASHEGGHFRPRY